MKSIFSKLLFVAGMIGAVVLVSSPRVAAAECNQSCLNRCDTQPSRCRAACGEQEAACRARGAEGDSCSYRHNQCWQKCQNTYESCKKGCGCHF